jgi:hypothetical protein
MTRKIDVAVVGAGPYGLAVTAQLEAAGFETKVFGEPMRFWREQTPKGMLLRSPRRGSDIGDPRMRRRLQDFSKERLRTLADPVPVEDFIDYGDWFCENAVSTLDRRAVRSVDATGDGFRVMVDDEPVHARRVVVAAGIGQFGWSPPQFENLGDHVSHTLEHHDLSRFGSQRVCIVGGGQSALGTAALLHELGADVEVLVREPEVIWLRESAWHHTIWPINRILFAKPDVGPALRSHLIARPGYFRRLPRDYQDQLARRASPPSVASYLRSRCDHVRVTTGTEVRAASLHGRQARLELSSGEAREFDHVLLGTGYRVDLARYGFLPAALRAEVDCVGGYPRLSNSYETSVPGLHIVGAPAAWSFGPIMRFVFGSGFAARAITDGIRR